MASQAAALDDWKSRLGKQVVGRIAQEGIEEAVEDAAQDAAEAASPAGD